MAWCIEPGQTNRRIIEIERNFAKALRHRVIKPGIYAVPMNWACYARGDRWCHGWSQGIGYPDERVEDATARAVADVNAPLLTRYHAGRGATAYGAGAQRTALRIAR